MPRKSLTIADTVVASGEMTTVMLPMPKLYDWTPMTMPVHVIHGKKPGPTLLITATIHGDEINGIGIIRQLMKKKFLRNLNGTLLAVPIVNIYGFLQQSRYLMDRRDLNRAFPGSKKGSLASRLAELVRRELLTHTTHIIDLHTGSSHRINLPQIRADLEDKSTVKLTRAFNAPVALNASLREGSMRWYASENNIPYLLYEAGEALRFDELSIRMGVRGIINVMTELKMLNKKHCGSRKIETTLTQSSYWVRAPYSGTLHHLKKLGNRVEKNEQLAIIANPTSNEEHSLRSPIAGIIIGISDLPLVHAGAALYHIACVKKLALAEQQIELLQEDIHDE